MNITRTPADYINSPVITPITQDARQLAEKAERLRIEGTRHIDQVVQLLRQAAALDPADSFIGGRLGVALLEAGRGEFEKGRDLVLKAYADYPNDPFIILWRLTLALSHYNPTPWWQALTPEERQFVKGLCEKLHSLEPGNTTASWLLASGML